MYGEITKKEDWVPSSLNKEIPFTQQWFYSKWQETLGRDAIRLVGKGDSPFFWAQFIKYKLPFGKTYLYCPYGPILSKSLSQEEKDNLFGKLIEIGQREKSIFIRLDKNVLGLNNANYSSSFQPENERVINIEKSHEELLSGMDKKIRYSIRLAEKEGVEVEIVDTNLLSYLDEFYDAISLSAQRNKINLYPKKYYKKILELGEQEKNVFLTFTRYKDKVLVASLTVISGTRATQIFSGSTDYYRKLRPAAITRIKTMMYAKSRGVTEFSLGGISTDSVPVKEWEGLSKFKEKFGGRVVQSSDPGVLVISRFWFALYNLYKIIR